MILTQLPIELQRLIAEQVSSEGDLNALAQTSRGFYQIANRLLYLHNVKYSHRSSLFWAALKGCERTVHLAMEAGADINACRPNGMTPLLQAVACHQEGMAKMLLRHGATPSTTDTNPLVMAALIGSSGIVQLLLDYNTDVNIVDDTGRTALSYAAEMGSLSCIRVLLDAGADVNLADQEENTPLHYAEMYGMPDAVDILLDAGARILPLPDGRTPLSVAVEREYLRTVVVMLSKNSTPEGVDSSGHTPLHWAVQSQNWDCLRALLKAGYDPAHENNDGLSAIDFAGLQCATTMQDVLSKHSK